MESKATESAPVLSQSVDVADVQDKLQQTPDQGSTSNLSPFAVPFMPRDSTISTLTQTLPLKPLTVDVSRPGGEFPSPTPSVGPAADDESTASSGLLMLADRPEVSPSLSVWLPNETTSTEHVFRATMESEQKADPFYRSTYFLMLSGGLQQSSPHATNNAVPIGFEREGKRRSSSLSSWTSTDSESSGVDGGEGKKDDPDGVSVYRLFSGGSGPCASLFVYPTGQRLDDGLTEEAVGSDNSLFGLSQKVHFETKDPDLFSVGDCHANTGHGSLMKSLSFLNDMANNEPNLCHGSSSDLLAAEVSTQTKSLHDTVIHDDSINNKETSGSDTETISDDETTLLADVLTDENGNILMDNVFTDTASTDTTVQVKIPVFDSNGNLVGTANDHEEQKQQIAETKVGETGSVVEKVDEHETLDQEDSAMEEAGRRMFSSSDSGFGSVSEAPSIILPELESDWEGLSSSRQERLKRRCSRHAEQLLTLYCTSCCQTLCVCCFAMDHMDCSRVLSTSLACRDLRWQLLKMQTSVSTTTQHLQHKVHELKPRVHSAAQRKEETKNMMNDQLHKIIKEIRFKHERLLEEVEEDFRTVERQGEAQIQSMEKSLVLLNYASKFLEVLRRRDSGWELLSTFDQRLNHLLQRVLHTAESSLDSVLHEEADQMPQLNTYREKALNSVLNVLDKDQTESKENQPTINSDSSVSSETNKDQYEPFMGKLFAADWGCWAQNRSSDEGSWEAWKRSSTGNGLCDSKLSSPVSKSNEAQQKDEDDLIREILAYLHRFPPPSTRLPTTSTSSLYDEMMDSPALLSPFDLVDDVFLYDNPSVSQDTASDVFSNQSSTAECTIQQRMCPRFPQDTETPFVTDMHITETGRLVFLDAANHCLKRVDLRQPSTAPARYRVAKLLSICSAGWERVMVSCAGRALGLYSVGGQHVRLVATRCTRQQYRGLARATDALVAAACPESRSVDLLDLGGRVLRSVLPVDFVRGPEVVGATTRGELLVVHQPASPPTILVCFDMAGNVIWEHEMRARHRHVSCSKVVAGDDGYVYYTLQGDSVVYRIQPQTGEECALLTSRQGVLFPSSLALDQCGRVLVTRNELPSVHFDSPTSQPMLPSTNEIDVFAQKNRREADL